MTKTKKRLDVDLLTSAEIEALMRACSPRAATGLRKSSDHRARLAVGPADRRDPRAAPEGS